MAEYAAEILAEADAAAYRALAEFRITAAHRRRIAAKTVEMLCAVPAESMGDVIANAKWSMFTDEIRRRVVQDAVSLPKRLPAAVAAVEAAAQVLAHVESKA